MPVDVTTLFLHSLLQSAEAFLGKDVDGAAIAVPGWFTPGQLDVLQEAAEGASIRVFQLLEDPGAAALCAAANAGASARTLAAGAQLSVGPDRTQLVVDSGAFSLSLSLLAVRQGLFYHLTPQAYHPEVGGDAIDGRLLKSFAKDFTKKMSMSLKVAPASEMLDLRAEVRLQLALLLRTISVGAFVASIITALESS
jgi:molecular chaperone DnaK (HSP70)